jgi:glycine betaine/proline transport system permease protein
MDWLFKFPQIDPDILLSVKRAIDGSLKTLTRNYGQSIENFFYPLQQVLIFFERMISNAPWPLVVLALAAIAWFAARSVKVVVAVILHAAGHRPHGPVADAMKTISLVLTATSSRSPSAFRSAS